MSRDGLIERSPQIWQALVKPAIVNLPTRSAQLLGKVAHRRKDQDKLLLVMIDIERLGLNLGHKHHIAAPISPHQRSDRGRELIAKYQD